MFWSIQQRYILETLKKLGYVRQEQLQTLVRGEFPRMNVSDRSMDAMLRQLRNGAEGVQMDREFVWLSGSKPYYRRLEAINVMLELSENRLEDFSVCQQSPELLRFSLEGVSLRLFTVATVSDPLHSAGLARDSPERVIWISDSGSAPPKHFFAARQPDGSHRFYGSE